MIPIGFGYAARQGKDYAVKAIIEARNGQFDVRRYSFAQELKREVNEAAIAAGGMLNLFGKLNLPAWVHYEENPDMSDPDCPLGKQRTLLQWWGTELRRNADQFYWIHKLQARLEKEQPQFALISDMRFWNEMQFIKSLGGYTVKVERIGYEDPGASNGHASEVELRNKKFDITISVASGEVEQLRQTAVKAFDWVVWQESVDAIPDFTLESFEKDLEEADSVLGTAEL